MSKLNFIVVFLSFSASAALSLPTLGRVASRQSLQLNERAKESRDALSDFPRNKRKCNRCPEPLDDDVDMDRREAAFAMVGSLWAMTTSPLAASAAYGQDAKIELPNPVGDMNRRNNEQCLVESLGTRQCLVYLDPANKLYQQPDNKVLLERLDKASASLASIPSLVSSKKWSQVSGVLTGPLGQLVLTMQALTKLSENGGEASALAKKVKSDILEIGAASDRKQGDKVLEYHQKATDDLVAFVKSL